MPDLNQQVEDLANKIRESKRDLEASASYYDASHRLETVGISTPPEMRKLSAAIGWPRMYLDALEERLDIEGFRVSGKSETNEQMRDWWQANDLDEESGLGHLDALIYGRSYVTVAAPGEDDDDFPLIRVESPLSMYAETDPRTRKITRAIRLYERQDQPAQGWATLYLPDSTIYLVRDLNSNGQWRQDGKPIRHRLGAVPVVPLFNRERLADRDGRSEIIPELRTFTDVAARTMMNMQTAAELMAVPQRVLFGVDPESVAGTGTQKEILDAYMARIITLESEMGKAFQFSSAELMNFVNVLQELAKHVASYTGLPPQYLTFSSDNPASAEAIKSSESRLVKKCERKARMFGGSWERVMRLANLVMGKNITDDLRSLETVWRDPSTPTYASKADAASKLYNSGNGIIPLERARIDMGYSAEERAEMKEWDEDNPQAQLSAIVARALPSTGQPASPAQRSPEKAA